MADLVRRFFEVSGAVQGVGFRPFVYREAVSRELRGQVINTARGVEIDIEGTQDVIDDFFRALKSKAPPNARITDIHCTPLRPAGFSGFSIGDSKSGGGGWQLVNPDSCTCDDCLKELFDPGDRRYRYPFINCTNCGPRFTIINQLPYDRPLTTMSDFEMCPQCRREYENPLDRRFHAEPNACPECGPQVWLADAEGHRCTAGSSGPIGAAASLLKSGAIIAIKGLGGYQLACLATDDTAVRRLRKLKRRPDKPFAVMAGAVPQAKSLCRVSQAEQQLLESAERPVVLLEMLPDTPLSGKIAPRLAHAGIMLPCSPVHFLLMDEARLPLVMTSGNRAGEPICRTNSEAAERLAGIADYFLMHDRRISSTYDDSVAMVCNGRPLMIRRARGYAPLPVKLPQIPAGANDIDFADASVLATGADLKNTFCLTRGDQAFVSQHIGDLSDGETMDNFERNVKLYGKFFGGSRIAIAGDAHPGYHSTAFAQDATANPKKASAGKTKARLHDLEAARLILVQHHRAHIASCLAENCFTETVVAVAFDGTGAGDDSKIWGGEFFTGSLPGGFKRAAHLAYMPLPGGEAAIHEPRRSALAAAWRFVPKEAAWTAQRLGIPGRHADIIFKQMWAGLNCPQTSSCGRLIDAVAAIITRRREISYEAQAAMELEALAMKANEAADLPDFVFDLESDLWSISPAPAIAGVISALSAGENTASLALGFHLSLIRAIAKMSLQLAQLHSCQTVALSGGVFQNRLLLTGLIKELSRAGLTVLTQKMLPPNDGGISLGQAALAMQEIAAASPAVHKNKALLAAGSPDSHRSRSTA